MTWHIRSAFLAFLLALAGMFTLTPEAHAQPSPAATAACIEAGKAKGMYWPGANPARNPPGAEYNIAVWLTPGTPVSADENGAVGVIKYRGALACGTLVLVKASDINPATGMVSQGYLTGCNNWSTFPPVKVVDYLVTEYPGQDRVLYDPREDDLLDALFISDAFWLSAARQSSCIGGVWDPDGRVDARTNLYRPSFVPHSSEGYVVEDRTQSYTAITYQGSGTNHNGDNIRNAAANLTVIRSCPTDPLLVWKGKIKAGEDGQPYEVECEIPQNGERISATLSAGMKSFESYVMDLQANGQGYPDTNGTIYLNNLCPRQVDQALVDRQNILIDMDAWYSRKLRLHVAFKGLAGSDILLTDPNPYFASTAFVGGGLVQVGASVGNDHRRFVPFALVIPQYHGGTEFYALAPAGLGFGGGAAYQGGERNDVGWSAGGGYYHSWAAWTDAEGDRWDSLDDTYFTELNLLIHPRGELLGYVDGRAVYEGGARSGSFVIGLHTAVSTRSGLEPGSMMSLAQVKGVLGYQF